MSHLVTKVVCTTTSSIYYGSSIPPALCIAGCAGCATTHEGEDHSMHIAHPKGRAAAGQDGRGGCAGVSAGRRGLYLIQYTLTHSIYSHTPIKTQYIFS